MKCYVNRYFYGSFIANGLRKAFRAPYNIGTTTPRHLDWFLE